MRILVARPLDAALATAEKLRQRGHVVLVAPALEIAPTHARPPPGAIFDLALASSAQGFADWPADGWRGPIGCVGEKTAQAAAQAGFDARWIAPNAQKLAALLRAALPPQRALYLAGQERKPTLERELAAAGWKILTLETYAAREVAVWPAAVRAALAAGEIDALLHYSPRSARAALRLAGPAGLKCAHFCLSADVAATVGAAGLAAGLAAPGTQPGVGPIFTASQPDEEALHILLDAR